METTVEQLISSGYKADFIISLQEGIIQANEDLRRSHYCIQDGEYWNPDEEVAYSKIDYLEAVLARIKMERPLETFEEIMEETFEEIMEMKIKYPLNDDLREFYKRWPEDLKRVNEIVDK